jgi:hypothetical protein
MMVQVRNKFKSNITVLRKVSANPTVEWMEL